MTSFSKCAMDCMLCLGGSKRLHSFGFLAQRHGQKAVSETLSTGILAQGPPLDYWPDGQDECGNDRFARIHYHPEHQRYECELTGQGRVTLEARSVARYRVDHSAWLRWIVDQLHHSKHALITEMTPYILWNLGGIWHGKRRIPLWLGIDTKPDALLNALSQVSLQSHPPLLLTPYSLRVGHYTSIPHSPHLVALDDLLEVSPHNGSARFNLEPLGFHTDAILPQVASHPVQWDVNQDGDEGVLTIYDTRVQFHGKVQCSIVQTLVTACYSGEPKRRTNDVLKMAGSTSNALTPIFKRHPNWDSVIAYGQGYCWLIVPQN